MSLVNQMLKDLEQRRAQVPNSDRLRGLHAAAEPARGEPARRWPLVVLAAGVLGGGAGWWLSNTPATAVPTAVAVMAPVSAEVRADDPATEVSTADAVVTDTAEIETAAVSEPPTVPAQPASKTIASYWDESLNAVDPHDTAADRVEAGTESTEVRDAPASGMAAVAVAEPGTVPVARDNVAATPSGMHKTARIPSPEERARKMFADAYRALNSGDLRAAESALRHTLALDPYQETATETLTVLLLKQNRGVDAEAVLATALAQRPQQPRLAQLYARLLADAGRDAEAVAALEAAGPGDAEQAAMLAALQQRLGNDSAAVAAYRQALQSAPSQGLWWLGLAISLEREGQPGDALAAYRNALADAALTAQVSSYVRTRIAALGDGRG